MREPPAPAGKGRDDRTRSERLATALRANLARRKAQKRARTEAADGDDDTGGQNDKNEG